jgi:plastocyanin
MNMLGVSARRSALVGVILILAIVAASCGGDDGNGNDGGGGAAGAGGATSITIADLAFDPSTVTVSSGATEIEITNDDEAEHTFTLDDDSVDQDLAPGESATVTVDVSSTTGFHCAIHPEMTGTLEVG